MKSWGKIELRFLYPAELSFETKPQYAKRNMRTIDFLTTWPGAGSLLFVLWSVAQKQLQDTSLDTSGGKEILFLDEWSRI